MRKRERHEVRVKGSEGIFAPHRGPEPDYGLGFRVYKSEQLLSIV